MKETIDHVASMALAKAFELAPKPAFKQFPETTDYRGDLSRKSLRQGIEVTRLSGGPKALEKLVSFKLDRRFVLNAGKSLKELGFDPRRKY